MLTQRIGQGKRGMCAAVVGLQRQRGVALFVGLVFLVMLSLVAIVVMKDTLLETRMTTATVEVVPMSRPMTASERMFGLGVEEMDTAGVDFEP